MITAVDITAVDLLNGRVMPFFEEHVVSLLRISPDLDTQHCGVKDHREYFIAATRISTSPSLT
ncbi:MAG: hypothetical protein P8M30_14585 [Planctomycetaceae bacterium]|nr:hypothetical protein [Planctomycetaceae bacterium]